MRTIFKFPFIPRDEFKITMPKGADVLHVALQGDQPCIWAAVDNEEDQEPRDFRLVGTGHPLPPVEYLYVGTFQQPPFVWHLFEIPPTSTRSRVLLDRFADRMRVS